ncbi:hypothetical protein IEO21_07795 [Rhodonia placenta]|uniref:RTA1-domain-containing protein n=1 Tax=Rhodonia placenta TaxID=104341 RepID=A0A8H7NXG5_9APHY|nr:hypothetical protein IEO21_07795 [Postia placenta]
MPNPTQRAPATPTSTAILVHAGQATHTRLFWLFPTICTAGILEIVGWSGRLWSSKNILAKSPYLMQIVTTIIAPTFLVAANFVILGQMIRRLGQCYSRISAKWYTIIFCSFDAIALIIQAVGGATAATAVDQNKNPNKGGHIMLIGIVIQMFGITIYMALAAEFILRYLYDRPVRASGDKPLAAFSFDRKHKLMLAGLTFSSICIYIRAPLTTLGRRGSGLSTELANGWTGYIIHTQRYFDWLDGGMITLAMFTVNFFHPGFLLGPARTWATGKEVDIPLKQMDSDIA